MNELVSKFVELFNNLPDQRQEWKIKHKLVDIVFIAVVCAIADCDDWEEMEWFAREKESWFRKYLELPNGIPSHDTIERVFSWLDPNAFRAAFQSWLSIAMAEKEAGVISIDGKTMRGTRDVLIRGAHVVNAVFSENGFVLGQMFTEEKSNEITAIPTLLNVLDVAGNIVTIDAAGTQKNIAEKIIEKKGDYVLAVKGNQPTLQEEIELFFKTEAPLGADGEYCVRSVTLKEKGHGRIETRTYFMTDRIGWLSTKDQWAGLKSIGMVRRRAVSTSTGAVTEEDRYFISSLSCDVHRFAYAVRMHWGVESMHWCLDMTWNEDARRSRKDNSAKNLAQLNRLSYDVIKAVGKMGRMPLKRHRKMAMLNEAYLEKVISAIF